MSDVASDGDVVDFGEEVGLIDVGVGVVVDWVEVEVGLFLFFLAAVEKAPYLFHVDNPVDLAGGEFAESVFAAGSDGFLVHA